MKKLKKVSFAAHARIKDIVGRGLINNDNVAIIELIKNSKDAGSKNVKINFSDAIQINPSSKLIIQDAGQGMSLDDIKFKWLNIAYSDKKHGINMKGLPFAGSKGIGRFSCDRLGKKLDLYTKANSGEIIHLPIDWTAYEIDERTKKVSDIYSTPNIITNREFKSKTGLGVFKSGTVLVINELRSSWGSEKLKKLRRELERFVIDPNHKFAVYLHSSDFPKIKQVNGKVENKIFDKLDFRTTSIHSEIDEKGKEIKTTLRHDAHDIFTLIEKNPYLHLKSISVSLYYLNQPAKSFFKRETGYSLVDFGSVFLFLNGFRVIPYGEPTNDWLAIDRRKQQGHSRYLGTREIFGRVEITDKDDIFSAISSREGLVHNEAYLELTSNQQKVNSSLNDGKLYGYIQNLFRKLEMFVVEGLDWDRINREVQNDDDFNIEEGDIEYADRDKSILESLASIIYIRSDKENITNIIFNEDYIKNLALKEISSYEILVRDIKARFSGLSISQLEPVDKRDLSKFIERQAKELASKRKTNLQLQEKAKKLREDAERIRKTTEQLTSENLFLRAQANEDLDAIINLHHQTILYADTIAKAIINFRRKIEKGFDPKKAKDFIDKIEMQNNKILKISRFATHANFRISSAKANADIFTFIKKYLSTLDEFKIYSDLCVVDNIPESLQLAKKFRPLELTMVIDNLLNNAKKANARKIKFSASKKGRNYLIIVSNDGDGLSKNIDNLDSIFEKGVTTTSGSGLGLFHLKKVVSEDFGGDVFVENSKKGNFAIGIKIK